MCTRVSYTLDNGKTYNGRNMDWAVTPQPDIWAYPKGISRDGAAGPDSPTWVSDYASITTANFNVATSDGVNEEGLVANLLWLGSSVYPEQDSQRGRKPLSLAIWAQYILDTCKNVEEAIKSMDEVCVVTAYIPYSDKLAQCHLSVSDAEGNSAIFEYVEGVLNISSNVESAGTSKCYPIDQMRVMTNDPVFSQQLLLNGYWETLNDSRENTGADINLPGSSLSPDRFVRASYYSKHLLTEDIDNTEALAGLAGV
ncbi:MAG: linear amide C-N hydrolase, partial [Algicola sp.]|nr:linear amide C-N hydrolase [Algicola sp.]